MAFIVSKLVRAALALRPVGEIAGGISPCLPRLYLTGGTIRRMSAAADSSESEEDPSHHGYWSDEDPEIFPLVDENSIKSKESLWALYKKWCKYEEVSRDNLEMIRRFRSFKASAMAVYKMNNSGSSQVSQLGPFADLTKAEIARLFPPRGRISCQLPGETRAADFDRQKIGTPSFWSRGRGRNPNKPLRATPTCRPKRTVDLSAFCPFGSTARSASALFKIWVGSAPNGRDPFHVRMQNFEKGPRP